MGIRRSILKVLANAEDQDHDQCDLDVDLPKGYGNDFDITKLRYDKIIIMGICGCGLTHLQTLLLTLFYRFMPELMTRGMSILQCRRFIKRAEKRRGKVPGSLAPEKYRGGHMTVDLLFRDTNAGEMDADQLWETMLNPETRILKLVEIEDARTASGGADGYGSPAEKGVYLRKCNRGRTGYITEVQA